VLHAVADREARTVEQLLQGAVRVADHLQFAEGGDAGRLDLRQLGRGFLQLDSDADLPHRACTGRECRPCTAQARWSEKQQPRRQRGIGRGVPWLSIAT
jgi:hypothetical protein